MPAGHRSLHLARRVVLIPQPREHRHRPKIPSRARIISRAARISLQMNSIGGARKLSVDLRNHVRPITALVKRVGHHVIAQIPQHHAKRNCGRRIKTILIVEIDGIERRYRRFQRLKILIQNARRPRPLRIHQVRDVLPVSVIGRADAERHPLHRPKLQLSHVPRKIRIVFVADIHAAGGQRKLAIEIQVARGADLDAPHNGFRESGVLNLSNVGRRILVKRTAPKNSRVPSLTKSRFARKCHCHEDEKKHSRAHNNCPITKTNEPDFYRVHLIS